MADKLITDMQDYKQGEVRIANDVISVIAGMALCDLNGVYIDGKSAADFVDRNNAKSILKSIKIDVAEDAVAVSMIISVEYGINISNLCKEAQEKVKSAIQTMTGLVVSKVDIIVQDIIFRKENKGDTKR